MTDGVLRPPTHLERVSTIADGRVMFDDFELNLESGELWRLGEPVTLRPLATGALVCLVRRAGLLVSREELRQELWKGSFVEWDLGLNQCVRQIRRALGDDAHSPRYVQTVPRRGYRFVAPVRPTGVATGDRPGAVAAVRHGNPGFFTGMTTALALVPVGIILFLLICAVLAPH